MTTTWRLVHVDHDVSDRDRYVVQRASDDIPAYYSDCQACIEVVYPTSNFRPEGLILIEFTARNTRNCCAAAHRLAADAVENWGVTVALADGSCLRLRGNVGDCTLAELRTIVAKHFGVELKPRCF